NANVNSSMGSTTPASTISTIGGNGSSAMTGMTMASSTLSPSTSNPVGKD
ncbi:hypothetical protein A2U01_0093071, partial [Trifolium medium]|nr:hypothetical protein [Trifolium medium]